MVRGVRDPFNCKSLDAICRGRRLVGSSREILQGLITDDDGRQWGVEYGAERRCFAEGEKVIVIVLTSVEYEGRVIVGVGLARVVRYFLDQYQVIIEVGSGCLANVRGADGYFSEECILPARIYPLEQPQAEVSIEL